MKRVGSVVSLRHATRSFVVAFDAPVNTHCSHYLAIGFEDECISDLAAGTFTVGHRRDISGLTYEIKPNSIVSLIPERLIGANVYTMESPRPTEPSG
jgi:hypothetical protein